MENNTINISYDIDKKLYEYIVNCSTVVFWNVLLANELDGFTVFEHYKPEIIFDNKKMLCVKKSGKLDLHISHDNFIEIIEEYINSSVFALSNSIKLMTNIESSSDIISDDFWVFYDFMLRKSKKRVLIPLP